MINNPNWCDGCTPENCPGCSEEFQEQDELMEQARLLGISAEREMALRARVQKLERERDNYKAACDEWLDKTDWVQQTAQHGELGKHRADVLRERIDRAVAAETGALIASLRALSRFEHSDYSLGDDAADAIEALHARVQELECFAALVAAREREACAAHYLTIMRSAVAAEREACLRLAERRFLDSPSAVERGAYQAACKSIAADIRARGAQGESDADQT